MFDFGFSELLLTAVVALLVLGPERLPRAARVGGLWLRRARASWYSMKSQVERELADDDLRRSLRETRQQFDQLRDTLQQPLVEPEQRIAADDRLAAATGDAASRTARLADDSALDRSGAARDDGTGAATSHADDAAGRVRDAVVAPSAATDSAADRGDSAPVAGDAGAAAPARPVDAGAPTDAAQRDELPR